MPVWRIAPVTDEPHVSLTDWQVMELPNGDRHFMGYAVEAREGRASSVVVTLDIATLRGVTRSGRVYRLRGRPGANSDAQYTWQLWARVNGAEAWTDVSEELWAQHQEARSAGEPET